MLPSTEIIQAAALGILTLGYMAQWMQRLAQSRNGGTPQDKVLKELRCLTQATQDIKTEVVTTRTLLQFITTKEAKRG